MSGSARRSAIATWPGSAGVSSTSTPDELSADVIYQIGALQALAHAAGSTVSYVKPHGALYNTIVNNHDQARAVAEAVHAVDPNLPVLGLSGSVFFAEARTLGLRTVPEAFADRSYRSDGQLVSRRERNAVLHDPAEIADRVASMVNAGRVAAVDGSTIPITVESVCVHGDSPGAVQIANAVRDRLVADGVELASVRLMRLKLGRPDLRDYAGYFDVPAAQPGAPLTVTWAGVTTLLIDDGDSALMTDGFFSRPSLADVGLRSDRRRRPPRIDGCLARHGRRPAGGRAAGAHPFRPRDGFRRWSPSAPAHGWSAGVGGTGRPRRTGCPRTASSSSRPASPSRSAPTTSRWSSPNTARPTAFPV